MFQKIRRLLPAAVIAYVLAMPHSAQAAHTVTVIESGGNVVAIGSGPINVSALTRNPTGISGGLSGYSLDDAIILGGQLCNPWGTGVIAGPASFNASASYFAADSGSGGAAGFSRLDSMDGVCLPTGYVSNAALSTTSTWNGRTFASMGLVPGTYVWTWGSGGTADSFTLQIGAAPASVPTLSEWAMVLFGLMLAGCAALFIQRRQLAA